MQIDIDKVKKADSGSSNHQISPEASEILTPDGKRDESQKSHLHKIKIVCFYVLAFFVIVLAFIMVYHMSMPKYMRWLNDQESAALKGLFFTGVGAGILGKFGNKLAP